MDRGKCRDLQIGLEHALKAFATGAGLQVSIKPGSFTNTSALFKVELAEMAADGQPQTMEANLYRQYARFSDLPADSLGAEFEHQRQVFQIVGYNPKAHAYPIVRINKANGRRYKMSLEAVRHGLAAKPKA